MSALKVWDGTQWVYVAGPMGAFTTEYTTRDPLTPASGVTVFARARGRRLPAFVGPDGQDQRLQPHFGHNKIARVNAVNNATTPTLDGMAVTHLNNATTTPTAVAVASTNFYTSRTRYRCATTATAGTGAGTRSASAEWQLSTVKNNGGFHFVCRFGLNTVAAGTRGFIGLSATTAALSPTVDPSTLFNQIGFGWDAANTTLQFMTNDGTGTATKVDLGANFPVTASAATYFYEVELFAAAGAGLNVSYSARRINDDVFAMGSGVTTDLPAAGTLLASHVHYSNGALAAAHSIDIESLYIETDN